MIIDAECCQQSAILLQSIRTLFTRMQGQIHSPERAPTQSERGLQSAGPNTLVGLATVAEGVSRSDLVARLVPAYVDLLKQLKVRSLER